MTYLDNLTDEEKLRRKRRRAKRNLLLMMGYAEAGSPGDAILTEAADFLTAENGDFLVQDVSPVVISLSNSTIAEDAANPSTVGTLSVNAAGSWTFTEIADPDNKFSISGSTLSTNATLDYETATSHTITIRADNGTQIIHQTLTVTVTDVVEASWTPASLGSALVAWYVADTGVTEAGTGVSQWNDQSGNGFHLTQGTDAVRPSFSATGFNSLPAVVFAAANNDTLINAAFTGIGGGATGSFYIVGQMLTGTDAFGRALSYQASGDPNDEGSAGSAAIILRDNANNAIIAFATGAARCTAAAISLVTNYRLGMIFGGATVTPYVNNVAGTGGAYSTAFDATGTLNVGHATGWDGPIAEVVITNTALSASDRNSLDTYFTTKWGL
jgi:VCBS repeat-containing protein